MSKEKLLLYDNKKIVVVMPAYNAAHTLRKTYDEVMSQSIVDLVIVVDDASQDDTVAKAKGLPNTIVHKHVKNCGYGANQKTCYALALQHGADHIEQAFSNSEFLSLYLRTNLWQTSCL